jgi:DNA-binding response OmpR family regulator
MPPKKILLVDDSSTILMMEKYLLRNDPYVIITASDGEEAVRKAVSERPDLILLDVIMPRMGGFEACRLIRDNEASKNIPIIMVTTRGEAVNVEAGWKAGCTDYITKPINAVELLAKVRSLVADAAASERGAVAS